MKKAPVSRKVRAKRHEAAVDAAATRARNKLRKSRETPSQARHAARVASARRKLAKEIAHLQNQLNPPARTARGHHAHHAPKKPKLSPYEVNCCSAEAVAASLRLAAGAYVSPDDMISLYWAVTQDPQEGATLEDILAAAHARGLAGWYPAYQPAATPAVGMVMSFDTWEHAATLSPEGLISWGETLPWAEAPDDAWQITWHK